MYQLPYYPQYAYYYNYTDAYMYAVGMSTETTQLFGGGYMMLSGISFLLYSRILTIIYFNMDLNKCSSYQILAHLGYAECIQLILNFIEGIFGVAVNVFTHWLAKICATMNLCALYCIATFTFALACNRFVQVVFEHYIDLFFSKWKTKLIIIICWLTGAPMFILMLIPNLIKVSYQPYWLSGAYWQSWTVASFNVVVSVNTAYAFCFYAISSLLYAAIVVSLVIRRGHISATEVRLTLQTGIVCGLSMAVLVAIYKFDFSNSVEYASEAGIGHFFSILLSSINPYIYLIFNRTLQSMFLPKFIQKIWNKNTVKVIHVTARATAIANTRL